MPKMTIPSVTRTSGSDSAAFTSDRSSPLPPGVISRRLKRLRRLAWLIDAALRVPGTKFRLGLNSLIGLPPVFGDAAVALVSLYFVVEAARLRAPPWLLARMAVNIGIEFGLGVVPVLGDVLDVIWKANLRNVVLLEQYFSAPPKRRL
jgi:hypothetical protein